MNSSSAAPALPPLTPCIGICRIDDDGYCAGCHRSLAEIAVWGSLDDSERERVMQTLDERAEQRG